MSKFKDLEVLLTEASTLSSKEVLSKNEERRYSFLLSAISAVKGGASLRSINEDRHNEKARAAGLPVIKLKKTKKKELRAIDFRKFVLEGPDSSHLFSSETELRDGAVHPTQHAPEPVAIGSYASLGYFTPAEFVKDVTKMALRLADELMDPSASQYIYSTNGRALVLPVANDTGEAAVPVGEGALDTADDLQYPGEVTLGAISFRSTYKASIEAFQDVESSGNLLNMWKYWTAQRIARGVGKYVMAGTNSDPIKGLITQLQNVGLVPIIASGSSSNDGSAATGANSLGSDDLATAFWSLDKMYRNSDRCCWAMRDSTLQALAKVKDKQGQPIVKWRDDGLDTIFGKRVLVCNNMSAIAPSNVTVVVGDFSYLYIRCVNDGLSGVRVLRERYIDSGQIGLQTITRWDSKLALTAIAGYSPFQVIQQHS